MKNRERIGGEGCWESTGIVVFFWEKYEILL